LIGGIVALILWFSSSPSFFEIIIVVFNILIAFLLAIVIILTGAMAGGDIKGIFVTGLSFPISYSLLITPFQLPEVFPAIFSILLNFFLLYLMLALSLFTINFIKLIRGEDLFSDKVGSVSEQLKLMFEGIYVETSSLKERKFYNPGERFELGRWVLHTPKFDGTMTDEEFDILEKEEREQLFSSLSDHPKSKIWIRPQIPGIVILFFSYLLTLTIGTILGPIFNLLVS
jgi:hypothetical protein